MEGRTRQKPVEEETGEVLPQYEEDGWRERGGEDAPRERGGGGGPSQLLRGLLVCFILINSFRFELDVYARVWPVGAVHGLDGFVLMATRAPTKRHSIPSNPLHTLGYITSIALIHSDISPTKALYAKTR